MRLRQYFLITFAPAILSAQSGSGAGGVVTGAVYDSIAQRFLPGATVQITGRDSAAATFTAVTDGRGRYEVTVRPGRYIVGFQHARLDSLALTASMRAVSVAAESRVRVDLGVPPADRILREVCQASTADSVGLLVGVLLDARTRAPVDTGDVRARWTEVALTKDNLALVERTAHGAVGREGWFGICGVPMRGEFAVAASQGADSTGWVAVTVPGGVARYDLSIGGNANVGGTITDESGRPVAGARVAFGGNEVARELTSDSSGAFRAGRLSAGSQTLDVRALGYGPVRTALVLEPGRDTTLRVTLTSIKEIMDTIRVVASRIYSADATGFERRMRRGAGAGRYLDEHAIRRIQPHDTYQLLQMTPGVKVERWGLDVRVVMRGGLYGGGCTPDLWINGLKMPADMVSDLGYLVRPSEVMGMEVYRSNQVPAEFASFNACGAIVVWLQPPRKR